MYRPRAGKSSDRLEATDCRVFRVHPRKVRISIAYPLRWVLNAWREALGLTHMDNNARHSICVVHHTCFVVHTDNHAHLVHLVQATAALFDGAF